MEVWEEALGPLLTARQAREKVGSAARLARLDRNGELIALETRSGETLYPAFQFDAGGGMPALAAAHQTLASEVSGWTAPPGA